MQRLVALDGLRGIAAIAVVLGHVLQHLPTTFFQSSYLAVDFFFVLSGFVLARTYEAKLAGGLSFRAYMERRLRRLYPALLVGLVLGLAIVLVRNANETVWAAAALQALMIPRAAGAMFPFNDVQWSLMFELLANAVHALIHRWLSSSVLVVIVLASAIALWTLSILHRDMNGGFDLETIGIGFARVSFSFFAGVGIHRLAAAARLRGVSLSFPVAAIALAAVLALPAMQVLPRVFADLAVATLAWPALVFLVAQAPQQPVRLHAFADWSGRLSYPLYAVHYPVVVLLQPWLASPATPIAERWLAGALVIALSIVLAMAVERYVERPILTRKGGVRPAAATS
jgi:peptidoglycan/LPS O-acetylase OafA/YrhL